MSVEGHLAPAPKKGFGVLDNGGHVKRAAAQTWKMVSGAALRDPSGLAVSHLVHYDGSPAGHHIYSVGSGLQQDRSRGDMEMRRSHGVMALLVSVAMLTLTGCGGGSSSPPSPSSSSTTYTVGGEVSGLGANESVVLLNNGSDPLIVSGDGGFTFSSSQTAGTSYAVTVQSHSPGITCPVTNGSGTVTSSDVTAVVASCAAATESLLYSFMGGIADGMTPQAGLIMDSAGNLYGTTRAGDLSDGGTVFKISAAGRTSILHFFSGGPTDGTRVQF